MTSQDTFEKPQLGVRTHLRVLYFFLKRDYKNYTFFASQTWMDIIGMMVEIATFFFIASMVGEAAVPGGNFASFVIVGLAFNRFLSMALRHPHSQMADAYWNGKLEMYLMAPMSYLVFFVATSVFPFLHTLIYVTIYLTVGVVVFGVNVVGNGVFGALLILTISTIAIGGLGLISASTFSLLEARIWGRNPVTWITNILVGLVAGIYYPIPNDFMPLWLQNLALFLPHYYAYDSIRKSLLEGVAISNLLLQISMLLVFCIVTLPLGLYLFRRSLEKTRLDGNLSRWS